MKTFLAFITLSVTLAFPAFAACYEEKAFFEVAKERYGETPLWTGKDAAGLTITMVLNPDTETWAIVKGDGKNVCVIVTGKGLGPVVVGDPA